MNATRELDSHPEVQRVRSLLKRWVRDSTASLKGVGEGIGANAYSILNGGQFIRVEHVYQILDIIGRAPAEFFAELYRLRPPADEERRIAGIPQSEIEATVRRLVRAELEDDRREKRSGGNGGES